MKSAHILALVLLAVIVGIGAYYAFPTAPDPLPETQNEQSQGKIDIHAVCEGALAYMTFPDGASADAFFAECKNGEHPEVIERYKAEMNLGDGAQI